MTQEVRIISLWQPWATLIALGLKQYETRSWSGHYRGKLAIHAAKRPIDLEGRDKVQEVFKLVGVNVPTVKSAYPLGCIVAIADLKEPVLMMPDDGYAAPWEIRVGSISDLERTVGNWQPGRYAWRLENVIALPQPIPFKGAQGLRRLDGEIAALLLEKTKEAAS